MTMESLPQKTPGAVFQNGAYLRRSSPAVLVLLPVCFFTHPGKTSAWGGLAAALFEKTGGRSARHGVSSDIQSKSGGMHQKQQPSKNTPVRP